LIKEGKSMINLKQNIVNRIPGILFIAVSVSLFIPISGKALNIMTGLVFAGIILAILLYTFRPDNLKIKYFLLPVFFIKTLIVLLIFKEAVLRSSTGPVWFEKIIQTASLQSNPVLWFYITGLIFCIYYILFKYHIMRRAEITSRFTLDAMPGRQMSIDAGLANGEISIEEANIKRKKLILKTDMAGAYHGLINLFFYESLAMTGLFLVSAIAVILREYYSTSHFLSVSGFKDLIALNIAVILSLSVNTILALIIPVPDLISE